MVSFSCEVCNDTVIKKKLDQHSQRCYGAYFTCIDCSTTFQGTSYRQHTSCISEAEKYEKALYKGPKKTNQKQQHQPQPVQTQKPVSKVEEASVPTPEPVKKASKKESKKEAKKPSSESSPLFKYLNANKQEGLYKVVKKLSKENSKEIKDILKTLKITKTDDGKIIIE